MAMQIYLHTHKAWVDILDECDWAYVAKDVDGVMTYVIKDGTDIIRKGETEWK